MRSRKSLGMSADALTTSSSVRAAMISRRSANGLRASSDIRLLAERMPTTSPSSSSTGRWFTPAVIMAMLASGASTSAPMVCTGADMISVTGACRETPPTTTLSRRSTSVTMPTMPVPPGPRTRIAERFSAIMICAASCAVVSGSQNSGLLRVTDVTGMVRTSGMARMVPAACSRRSRRLTAIHWTPDGRLSSSNATSPAEAVEQRVLPRPRRELRREAGEQRRMTDDLAGRHDGDVGVLVHQLERAEPHHVELLAGRPALDEDRLAGRHGALAQRSGDLVQLVRAAGP